VAIVARNSPALAGGFEVLRGGGSGTDALKKLAFISEMAAEAAGRELEDMADRQRQDVQNKQSERTREATLDSIRDSFDASSKDV
jgi:hypothetical protein